MIEVNLFSVSSADPNAKFGRCISRSRFNPETLGVSILEFVKGFLKDNLDTLGAGLGKTDLTEIINSDKTALTTKDLQSILYILGQSGFRVEIWNVADDEENAVGVPSGDVIEWNIIDHNFLQSDYPTATKIMASPERDIAINLRSVVEQSGLFDSDKFGGIQNPLTPLLTSLDAEKKASGRINYSLVTKIYQLLGQMGIDVFHAASED